MGNHGIVPSVATADPAVAYRVRAVSNSVLAWWASPIEPTAP